MRRPRPSPLIVLLLLAACATPLPRAAVAIADPAPEASASGWRAVIRPEHATRLDAISSLWATLLPMAQQRNPRAAAAEAELLAADAALDHPQLSPGPYRCRTVRLNARGMVERFRARDCFVKAEGDALTFVKQTGSDLPAGWLYPDGANRYVFLGTRVADQRPGAVGYGERPERDVVGVMERVGTFRWRLSLAGDSNLDLYELVPVAPTLDS